MATRPPPFLVFGAEGVRVVSHKAAEKADFVVCLHVTIPLMFPDNVTGPCGTCGSALQWRPTNPKKPPRICVPCVALRGLKPAGHA